MNAYDQGDLVRVDIAFADLDGVPTDPTTVALSVTLPDGTVTDPVPTHDATGAYSNDIDTTAGPHGVWTYRWTATGTIQAVESGQFAVKDPSLSSTQYATVLEVAQRIRSRTKTQGGAEAGTFNPAAWWDDSTGRGTRPTEEQTLVEINSASSKIAGLVGADFDSKWNAPVRALTSLLAAMYIELSYYQEQVNTGRSTYPQLKELFDGDLKDLLESMGLLDEDGDHTPEGGGYPSYGGFPTTAIGMEMPW